MKMLKEAMTIASGAAVSNSISAKSYNDHGVLVLCGIGMPATVDAVTLVVQFSFDDATWLTVSGSTITHTASTYFQLNPSEYAAIPGFFRLKLGGNAAAERVYTIIGRDA